MPPDRAIPPGMRGLQRLVAEAVVLAGGEHQCAALGHDWVFIGGKNACCADPDCCCSVPVHECRSCGDCDYGDNNEADQVRAACAEMGPA
jgi:hypothetical protein